MITTQTENILKAQFMTFSIPQLESSKEEYSTQAKLLTKKHNSNECPCFANGADRLSVECADNTRDFYLAQAIIQEVIDIKRNLTHTA